MNISDDEDTKLEDDPSTLRQSMLGMPRTNYYDTLHIRPSFFSFDEGMTSSSTLSPWQDTLSRPGAPIPAVPPISLNAAEGRIDAERIGVGVESSNNRRDVEKRAVFDSAHAIGCTGNWFRGRGNGLDRGGGGSDREVQRCEAGNGEAGKWAEPKNVGRRGVRSGGGEGEPGYAV